jgi:2-methylcitrate dehydratase PrpD
VNAALANGTAAHALDFDDVDMAIPGHPAAAIFPALLAAVEAESGAVSGQRLTAAYARGYEVMCRLGAVLTEEHYDAGFHATATLGAIGSAAACANLMRLGSEATANAIGIAATQSSGLKAMFGTMTKPFNAGRATSNGLLAARLAARSLGSRTDVIECAQGFAELYSAAPQFEPERWKASPGDWLAGNLFKYHAACYLVHAAIDAVATLRAEGAVTPDVTEVTVLADRSLDLVCNIAEPKNTNEAKFSLRAAVALALAGRDTASLKSFEGFSADGEAARWMEKIIVELQDGWPKNQCEVVLRSVAGADRRARKDSSTPETDPRAREAKLSNKFVVLVEPVLGKQLSTGLIGRVLDLQREADVRQLIASCANKGERDDPS